MRNRLLWLFCLAVLMSVPVRAAGDDVPAWLQQAAGAKTPAYPLKDVPAVVLHHEQIANVEADGKVTVTTTFAVRVLRREGRGAAIASESYITDSGKIKELRGWLLRANGQVKKYGKDETLDVAQVANDIYNQVRKKVIIAADDVNDEEVFGYQSVREERTIFSHDAWAFQLLFDEQALPAVVSRYVLNLPSGWKASSVTFNREEIKPVVNGNSYVWELRDLPPHLEEELSPAMSNIVPRLAVSYFPDKSNPNLKTFANWNEVAAWMQELEDPQMTVNDILAAKAKELTANAKTELEKIQAIGRYVQNIQYISIQTNIARGGGYRPHAATEVFTKSYGDCKDKANLMRAMLSVLKINSYMVSIYSGDPTYVRAEWASPGQFNHCIIAVKVSDETSAATVVKHPALGRLLIFDPTDDSVPVGDLPLHEQGSLALIDAKESNELLRMPVTPPDSNRLEREAEVVLASDGSLQGTIKELSRGHLAARFRGQFRALSRSDYNKMVEDWLASGVGGAKASKIEPEDFHAEGRFGLNVDFAATSYGQLMQGRLLVFKPAIVSRNDYLALSETKRTRPVQLWARAFSERVRIKLPAGFVVDETPDAEKVETPFGAYSSSYEIKDGHLIFSRRLTQQPALVPVEQYAAVRDFFKRIREADMRPVVLLRK
jgi:hypothetical protein